MASELTDLIDQAIAKYGSILDAPKDCEEFVRIRKISPDEDKPYSAEYKEKAKKKLLRFAERDGKILDLIDEGYPAEIVADKMDLDVSTVRNSAKRYGIREFGKYFRWYAEKNKINYYSTKRVYLEKRGFKPRDIKRVKLLRVELPVGAHYCEENNWHIKKRIKKEGTKNYEVINEKELRQERQC